MNKGEGTAVSMSALNWKPFVYGGLASITAECGKEPRAEAGQLPAARDEAETSGCDHWVS